MLHTAAAASRSQGRTWFGRGASRRKALREQRWAHAYRAGQTLTLCALPLELLNVEDSVHIDFVLLPDSVRCELCALLADRS